MNGRRAKHLRGLADTITVGRPRLEYQDQTFTRYHLVLALDGREVPVPFDVYTRRAKPDCTRAVYQRLKRAFKYAQFAQSA